MPSGRTRLALKSSSRVGHRREKQRAKPSWSVLRLQYCAETFFKWLLTVPIFHPDILGRTSLHHDPTLHKFPSSFLTSIRLVCVKASSHCLYVGLESQSTASRPTMHLTVGALVFLSEALLAAAQANASATIPIASSITGMTLSVCRRATDSNSI
jgi:hypothetical protein